MVDSSSEEVLVIFLAEAVLGVVLTAEVLVVILAEDVLGVVLAKEGIVVLPGWTFKSVVAGQSWHRPASLQASLQESVK